MSHTMKRAALGLATTAVLVLSAACGPAPTSELTDRAVPAAEAAAIAQEQSLTEAQRLETTALRQQAVADHIAEAKAAEAKRKAAALAKKKAAAKKRALAKKRAAAKKKAAQLARQRAAQAAEAAQQSSQGGGSNAGGSSAGGANSGGTTGGGSTGSSKGRGSTGSSKGRGSTGGSKGRGSTGGSTKGGGALYPVSASNCIRGNDLVWTIRWSNGQRQYQTWQDWLLHDSDIPGIITINGRTLNATSVGGTC